MIDQTSRQASSLRRRVLATLTFLIGQFLIGTATNLFVAVPGSHPGAAADNYFGGAFTSVVWSFSSGLPLLIVHVVVGLLLFFNAIEVIVRAVRSRRRAAVWLASLGAFGIVLAGINGASYLTYGQNFSSMLMAIGFALALGCYTYLLNLA